MALCKFCQKPFSWGLADGKWIPLVPIGEDAELDRSYQDENGVLRAEHRAICARQGGPTVRVARLAKTIPAREVLPAVQPAASRVEVAAAETVGQTIDRIRARKGKRKKQ